MRVCDVGGRDIWWLLFGVCKFKEQKLGFTTDLYGFLTKHSVKFGWA
jgi:hypothetical protein